MKGRPFSFLCRWLLLSTFLITGIESIAQNLKCKFIPAGKEVLLDSVAIEPGSITPLSGLKYDEITQLVTLMSSSDSVEICYRVLSDEVTKTFQDRDIFIYDSSIARDIFNQSVPVEKEELFEFGSIEKYGAITRGVSFGNRQSVFVNSSLNLQMNGQIADNLYVSAVITDQNIPYQPEGNTQQIRDFDNVFIKLYNDKTAVTAGDIVLNNSVEEDYFLRYYKNVQGLQFSHASEKKKWKYSTTISGAVAKGKFASILIPSIEGLTGPYKVRGPNGERFIIVLANSEKVFLDGRLMNRGFDQDYVIDYNLGEVTFNNHIIITQFSRIRVDFEYAEQFYSRSAVAVSQEIENDRVKLYSGYYREKDNPNTNFGFALNEDDFDQLQSLGDRTDQAFISGFDSIRFDEGRILYEEVDTLDIDGNPQSVFKYSIDPTQQLFPVTFSDVGEGNGDYILQQTSSNGRIYEWISPENGVRQGRYQPGAFIPMPNSRQLVNVGAEVRVNEYETVFSETAFSGTDKNLYSTIDDNDNNGIGYYGGIRSAGRSSFIDGYRFYSGLSVEYDTDDFTSIDRYRTIEFDRNWDIRSDTIVGVQDLIVRADASLEKDANNQLGYAIDHRNREGVFNGLKHSLNYNQTFNALQLVSSHSYLENSQSSSLNAFWKRSLSDLSFRKYKIIPGYVFELDENELTLADSVINTQMNFRSHEFYLTSGDSTKSTFRISYLLRQDRLPIDGRMEDFLFSRNLKMNYSVNGEKSNLSIDLNYRSTESYQAFTVPGDDIISGRVNWWGRYLKNNLTQNFSFSTGNSRELRREFVYLPVVTGEGTHTWRDLNDDGVQDLNEFFEAINPDERNYVKIFTPTDDYITAFQTFYTHSLDVRLPVSWRKQEAIKVFLSRLSANINLNINYRTISDSYNNRLNPFSLDPNDPNVLSARDQKRYTFFYNRNGRGVAGDITLLKTNNKQLLTQGFELKEQESVLSNVKVSLNKEYTLRISSTFGELSNRSDFLDSRNFRILKNGMEPQLIWQPTNSVRVIGSYQRENNRNELLETSQESSLIQRYKSEFTWSQAGKGSLRASLAWVNIDFEGDPGTYLGYLLLEALQPGINQTWQLNWQHKLSKGMQLSLLYNGRKSDNTRTIHTGNVQVTAFF
ncbi:MAG: hypothetical protein RIM99_09065 [Cyclobacteriaceae bacterium]